MRRIGLVFVVVALSAVYVAAQDMTAEQEREFNRQRLNVEVTQQFSGFVSLRYGMMGGESTTRWKGYRGFTQISEPEFYRIAGYEEEARQAERFRRGGVQMTIWGGVGYTIGMGIIVAAAGVPYDQDQLFGTLMVAGGTIAIGSAFPLGFGISRLMRNWSPASQSVSVAEEYNSVLRASFE